MTSTRNSSAPALPRRSLIVTVLAALTAVLIGLAAAPGSAQPLNITTELPGRQLCAGNDCGMGGHVQHEPMVWHLQSGKTGEVGDKATALLARDPNGISYQIRTTDLVPGHAYTVWLVVVNDPEKCDPSPCAAPQIINDPDVDAQVTFGRDGLVAKDAGTARFGKRFKAGPLLDGWFDVQGLDDPLGAEIHVVLNDHGPLINDLRHDMTTTYRGGCTDESLPEIFPPAAFADGTPGPNTCQLYQSVIFQN
jgi:hypothetical protein